MDLCPGTSRPSTSSKDNERPLQTSKIDERASQQFTRRRFSTVWQQWPCNSIKTGTGLKHSAPQARPGSLMRPRGEIKPCCSSNRVAVEVSST